MANKDTSQLLKQDYMMKCRYPRFTSRLADKNTRIWTGTIRPKPLSETYTVEISYTLGKIPKIVVLNPLLYPRSDSEKIPHVYGGNRPCLFLPWKWNSDQLVASTIVPWLSLWLFYYEVWHYTGDWKGGGEHPTEKIP